MGIKETLIHRFLFCVLVASSFAFFSDRLSAANLETDQTTLHLFLKSSAFDYGRPITDYYTCLGEDISPPLQWFGLKESEVVSYAIICEDSDAPKGTWFHWVYFNLPGTLNQLPPRIPQVEMPDIGGIQGRNTWKKIGYRGPCPPPGTPHRYFFRLYALDRFLDLDSNATAVELLEAMEGHIVAEAEWMGTYIRHLMNE